LSTVIPPCFTVGGPAGVLSWAAITSCQSLEKGTAVDYLPENFRKFQSTYPAVADAYDRLEEQCNAAGPLDERTRRLVKLGIAIGASAPGAVRSHARRALEAGISPADLRHAVALGLTTVGLPTTVAAMIWVNEVLEAERK